MTKERFILSFVAILAGLIVTSSLFYFSQKRETIPGPVETPTPADIPDGKKIALSIEGPENESVTDKKTITVLGKAPAESMIVITTDRENIVITSGTNGEFKYDIDLSKYENIITVTSYPENGSSETKEIIVTYSTEEF